MAELCPNLVVINENDDFYHAVTIKSIHDQKQVEALINEIIAVIGKMGAPAPIEKIAKSLDKDLGTQHVKALATVSKHLASLNGQWAVSYTHLDVYKRQIYHGPSRGIFRKDKGGYWAIA